MSKYGMEQTTWGKLWYIDGMESFTVFHVPYNYCTNHVVIESLRCIRRMYDLI